MQALALRDLQRFDEAALVYEEILPGLMERSGEGDPELLRERLHYAIILARGGHGDAGVAELDAAIAQITPHVVPEHPSLVLARTKRLQALLWSGRGDEALQQAETLWPLAHAAGDLPRRALLAIGLDAAAVLRDDAAWHHWMAKKREVEPNCPASIIRGGRRWESHPLDRLGHVEFMVGAAATGEHLMQLGEPELARVVLDRALKAGRAYCKHPWMTARIELGLAAVYASEGDQSSASNLHAAAMDRLASSDCDWLSRLIQDAMNQQIAQGD